MCIEKGPCSDTEGEEMASWREGVHLRVYEAGFMRGIYPLNFLANISLERPIADTTLEQWIKRDPRHGRLSGLTDTTALWEVEDQQIAGLQQVLFEARIIFDCDRDIVEDAPSELPVVTGGSALREVLEGFGIPAGDVDVFKVEEPGKTRRLSEAEVKKIAGKKRRGK
jgi:hypothetical protein